MEKPTFLFKKFDKPQAVEQLVFQVNTGSIEKFLVADHEVWTLGECDGHSFAGKEVWQSGKDPSMFYIVIYWGDKQEWFSITPQFLTQKDAEMAERVSPEEFRLLAVPHDEDMKYKVIEYMPQPAAPGWNYKELDEPIAVEELVIQVKPGMMESYLEADHAIWTAALECCDGFMGKEVWLSSKDTSVCHCIVYWESLQKWHSIPPQHLQETDARIYEVLGKDSFRILGALHEDDQKYKIREFRR